jgi:hypothetical protein
VGYGLVLILAGCMLVAPKKSTELRNTQDAVIAIIQKMGGFALVSEETPGKPVTHVSLVGARITNKWLTHLKALPTITWLDLTDTDITDAGLKHLQAFTALTNLRLIQTKVTDGGIRCLKRMPQLKYLYLRNTSVTKKGIAALRRALPGTIIKP